MVLMSSLDAEAVREVGRKLRVYEFLKKPFRTSDVLNAVSAYDRLSRVTRALLVDDSSTARKLMRRILERSQFRLDIQEAGSGEEALKLAGLTDFDAIFLDANMPGMSGPETAGIAAGQSAHADRHGLNRAANGVDPLLAICGGLRLPDEAVRAVGCRCGAAFGLRDPLAEPCAADACHLLGCRRRERRTEARRPVIRQG